MEVDQLVVGGYVMAACQTETKIWLIGICTNLKDQYGGIGAEDRRQ